MKRIITWLQISRPLNVLIGMLSIGLAGWLCSASAPGGTLLLAAVAGALVTAAANTINDFFDMDIDAVNRPDRPLPSGRLAAADALLFYGACNIGALFLAGRINNGSFLVVLFSCLLLFFYSARLKATVIWGNATVSLVTALAFLFGGFAVGAWRQALIPAGFAFLMHLGREIIKDLQDVAGDRAGQAWTLPVVHGPGPALRLAQGVLALLLAVTPLPYLLGVYGRFYLLIVLAGVDLVLFYVILVLSRHPGAATLGRLSTLLKWDMFVGLLAIYAGRWE